jgi:hypothetical protein
METKRLENKYEKESSKAVCPADVTRPETEHQSQYKHRAGRWRITKEEIESVKKMTVSK